jgi:hypothetical protein
MKTIYLLITSLVLLSCTQPKYKSIGQEIIDGKVSALGKGQKSVCRGCATVYPKIWVQTTTTTKEVEIPSEYDGRWKVGDSCLLIIEKYEIIKEE